LLLVDQENKLIHCKIGGLFSVWPILLLNHLILQLGVKECETGIAVQKCFIFAKSKSYL